MKKLYLNLNKKFILTMDEAMKRDITDILRFEIECEKYNPKEICKSAKNSLNSQWAIKIKYTNKLNEKKKELKDIMTFDWWNKRDELAK